MYTKEYTPKHTVLQQVQMLFRNSESISTNYIMMYVFIELHLDVKCTVLAQRTDPQPQTIISKLHACVFVCVCKN